MEENQNKTKPAPPFPGEKKKKKGTKFLDLLSCSPASYRITGLAFSMELIFALS